MATPTGAARVTCRCCDGTGTVTDILGYPRPCSRCPQAAEPVSNPEKLENT